MTDDETVTAWAFAMELAIGGFDNGLAMLVVCDEHEDEVMDSPDPQAVIQSRAVRFKVPVPALVSLLAALDHLREVIDLDALVASVANNGGMLDLTTVEIIRTTDTNDGRFN